MGHSCCVPGCNSGKSNTASGSISFFRLPLKNKPLLRRWIANIGKKKLPAESRICSLHFVNGKKEGTEVPVLNLPKPPLYKNPAKRKQPCERLVLDHCAESISHTEQLEPKATADELQDRLAELEGKVQKLQLKLQQTVFSVERFIRDDEKLHFYTGFSSREHFEACFKFLGPSVKCLQYWGSHNAANKEGVKCGPPRKLPPLEEFFLTLCRLRLGLLEEDLADRYSVHPSTISRIFITWVNFMYHKFKEIPLWPSRALIQQHMPDCFRTKYPSTRVIVDATEVRVVQPTDPAEQQMTFSNYKNTNTFKGLVGITPTGAVSFVSQLYSGSISDKELTQESGLLDLLEAGDHVMADRGFDIEDALYARGVKLNIPPFLHGKEQLANSEIIETRRIASLRIHVERAIERIKNFHFFDHVIPASQACIADQAFFVCAVLTNFCGPLVE